MTTTKTKDIYLYPAYFENNAQQMLKSMQTNARQSSNAKVAQSYGSKGVEHDGARRS